MISFVLLALPNILLAQSSSGSVKLSVVLSQVQSLTVNESQSAVSLDFTKKEDFRNGVDIREPNHLNVFSSGRFVVKVSTRGDLMSPDNRVIPASTIAVTPVASGGFTAIPGMTTADQVHLSAAESRTIIKSPVHGTTATSFDVLYHASGEGYAQMDNGTYTATVIYTIEVE